MSKRSVDYNVIKGIAGSHQSIVDTGNGLTKIAYGAWNESIKRMKSKDLMVPLLIDHSNGVSSVIGRITELTDRPDALYFTAEIEDRLTEGNDTLLRVRLGLLNSVSVGFIPVEAHQERFSNSQRGRIITQANLLEISVVTFPADSAAKIQEVSGRPMLTHKQMRDAKIEANAAAFKHWEKIAAQIEAEHAS